VRGRDMMLSALRRFDKEGVKVEALKGIWHHNTDSVNAAEFLRNSGQTGADGQLVSAVDAASNTWTGRLFGSIGFKPVEVVTTGRQTVVTFRRP